VRFSVVVAITHLTADSIPDTNGPLPRKAGNG
jgi:hypothetical protein